MIKNIVRLPIQQNGQPEHDNKAPFKYLKNNKVVCLFPWPVNNSGDNKKGQHRLAEDSNQKSGSGGKQKQETDFNQDVVHFCSGFCF